MVVRRQRGSGVIEATCEWQGALARPVCHRSDLRKPCQSRLQLGRCLCHYFSRRSILHCYTRPPPAGRHGRPSPASESRLSTTSSSQPSSVATPRSPKAAVHYASLPRRTVSTSAPIPLHSAQLLMLEYSRHARRGNRPKGSYLLVSNEVSKVYINCLSSVSGVM